MFSVVYDRVSEAWISSRSQLLVAEPEWLFSTHHVKANYRIVILRVINPESLLRKIRFQLHRPHTRHLSAYITRQQEVRMRGIVGFFLEVEFLRYIFTTRRRCTVPKLIEHVRMVDEALSLGSALAQKLHRAASTLKTCEDASFHLNEIGPKDFEQ